MKVKIFKGTSDKVESELARFLENVTEVLHLSQSGGGGSHEKLCLTIIWR